MNRLFHESCNPVCSALGEQRRPLVPLDAHEDGGSCVVNAEVPRARPGGLDITVAGSTLPITGESRMAPTEESTGCRSRERHPGSFHRAAEPPPDMDSSKIEPFPGHGMVRKSAASAAAVMTMPISVKRGSEPREAAPCARGA